MWAVSKAFQPSAHRGGSFQMRRPRHRRSHGCQRACGNIPPRQPSSRRMEWSFTSDLAVASTSLSPKSTSACQPESNMRCCGLTRRSRVLPSAPLRIRMGAISPIACRLEELIQRMGWRAVVHRDDHVTGGELLDWNLSTWGCDPCALCKAYEDCKRVIASSGVCNQTINIDFQCRLFRPCCADCSNSVHQPQLRGRLRGVMT